MGCATMGGKLDGCGYDCVASDRTFPNKTSGHWSTSCCCIGSLCNSVESRSINISINENQGLFYVLVAD